MRLNFKKILGIIMIFTIMITLTGCGVLDAIANQREKNRRKLFEEINQLEQNPNYALLCNSSYIYLNDEINFKSLIEQKLKEDNKKIKTNDLETVLYENNTISFVYKYKTQKRFLGINDNNNYYALGIIYLNDYSIDITYINNKYEELYIMGLTETSFIYGVEDNNNKPQNGVIDIDALVMNINTKEVKELEGVPEALYNNGKEIKEYTNQNTYIEDGIEYTVYESHLEIKNSEENNTIDIIRINNLLEKSDEMKKIIEILKIDTLYDLKLSFFTNNEQLFIGVFSGLGMFGYKSKLTFPIIFKCDTKLQNFDYIGCIDYENDAYYRNLQIIKK